jgi:hypothetical protein
MGSWGQAAFELARNSTNLNFIVQDSKNILVGVNSTITSDLTGRVTLEEHELFAPQNAKAYIYFFRMVFRGLDDDFATQALQAQFPLFSLE